MDERPSSGQVDSDQDTAERSGRAVRIVGLALVASVVAMLAGALLLAVAMGVADREGWFFLLAGLAGAALVLGGLLAFPVILLIGLLPVWRHRWLPLSGDGGCGPSAVAAFVSGVAVLVALGTVVGNLA